MVDVGRVRWAALGTGCVRWPATRRVSEFGQFAGGAGERAAPFAAAHAHSSASWPPVARPNRARELRTCRLRAPSGPSKAARRRRRCQRREGNRRQRRRRSVAEEEVGRFSPVRSGPVRRPEQRRSPFAAAATTPVSLLGRTGPNEANCCVRPSRATAALPGQIMRRARASSPPDNDNGRGGGTSGACRRAGRITARDFLGATPKLKMRADLEAAKWPPPDRFMRSSGERENVQTGAPLCVFANCSSCGPTMQPLEARVELLEPLGLCANLRGGQPRARGGAAADLAGPRGSPPPAGAGSSSRVRNVRRKCAPG